MTLWPHVVANSSFPVVNTSSYSYNSSSFYLRDLWVLESQYNCLCLRGERSESLHHASRNLSAFSLVLSSLETSPEILSPLQKWPTAEVIFIYSFKLEHVRVITETLKVIAKIWKGVVRGHARPNTDLCFAGWALLTCSKQPVATQKGVYPFPSGFASRNGEGNGRWRKQTPDGNSYMSVRV